MSGFIVFILMIVTAIIIGRYFPDIANRILGRR